MREKHKVNFFYTARFYMRSIIISTLKFPYKARFDTFTIIISTYDFRIKDSPNMRYKGIST